MKMKDGEEIDSKYRWVVAVTAGILTATSFISLTSFSVAVPFIAGTLKTNANIVSAFGVDGFSIGLLVAFFIGSGGFFDTRIKLGVVVAQLLLIVPQLLIPIASSLWLLTLLRFFQGLVIMILALFSLQLSAWFRDDERAISLSFTMGAIPFGGAIGGILSTHLLILSWQAMYYVSASIMLLGAIVYLIFGRNPEGFERKISLSKERTRESVWDKKITWIMGFLPTPVAWSLFSMGGFLPNFAYHLGYETSRVGNLMLIWGISGAISCFVGAFIGDKLVKGKKNDVDIFHARLTVMVVADALAGIGALVVILLGTSFYWLLTGAVVNAFSQILAPNYWASLSNVFPPALMGKGAFAMGLLSNIPSAIGPLISSLLIGRVGWNGFFMIMVFLAGMGILLSVLAFYSNSIKT